jgi:hypothetical protein
LPSLTLVAQRFVQQLAEFCIERNGLRTLLLDMKPVAPMGALDGA